MTQTDGTKTQTDSVYDDSMLVEEVVKPFDSTGAQIGATDTVTYLQGPGGPLYRKSSLVADPVWYVYDGLGSVVGEVNVNGNITGSKLYDVYGATRSLSGSPTSRQGFVGALGHESDDETGLVYMRARYYDPLTGRFASEDPGTDGHNWYLYCDDRPRCSVDSTGRSAQDVEAILALIGSSLTSGMDGNPTFAMSMMRVYIRRLRAIVNTSKLTGEYDEAEAQALASLSILTPDASTQEIQQELARARAALGVREMAYGAIAELGIGCAEEAIEILDQQ